MEVARQRAPAGRRRHPQHLGHRADGLSFGFCDGATEEPPCAPPPEKKCFKTPTTKMRAVGGPARPHRATTQRRRTTGPSASVVAIAGGLVLGVVAAIVFVASSGTSRDGQGGAAGEKRHERHQRQQPVRYGGNASPGRQGDLARIAEQFEKDLVSYANARAAIEAYAIEHADEPSAAEARVLLTTIDTRYGQQADDALAVAVARAEGLAAEGRRTEAEGAIRAVESLFADGPWLRTRGKKKVDEAVERLRAN
jgi:hypothetical protein